MDPGTSDWRAIDAAAGADPKPDEGAPAKRWRIVLGAAGGMLSLVFAATLWLAASAGSARDVSLEPLSAEPGGSGRAAAPGSLVVEVAGAVVRPGVYTLPGGSRIGDAIALAGGFSVSVDAAAANAALNLAAPAVDGTKVQVPVRGAATPSVPRAAGGGTTGGTNAVDLNSASQSELEALPGIGPVTAKKILDARAEAPFRAVDDLRTRKLVGQSTFEKIRALVSVGS